jgi:hypothetical protein
MNTKERETRLAALKEATKDFQDAVETLRNSSDPKDREVAEQMLKRAGYTKDDNGVFTPPSHPDSPDHSPKPENQQE